MGAYRGFCRGYSRGEEQAPKEEHSESSRIGQEVSSPGPMPKPTKPKPYTAQ